MVSIGLIVVLCLGKVNLASTVLSYRPEMSCFAGLLFLCLSLSSWLQSAWHHGNPPGSLFGPVFIGMSEQVHSGDRLQLQSRTEEGDGVLPERC